LNLGQVKQIVVAKYADDIVLMAEIGDNFKKTTKNLIEAARKIGLTTDENKTK